MSNLAEPAENGASGIPGPGTVLDDKYRVERLLGAGGMGAVTEGLRLADGERVAIKFLLPQLLRDEEAMARFERETHALMDVTSEHVVRFIDAGRLADRRPYLVMEYLEGEDLARLLDDGNIFSVEQAVELVLQACEAVGEAHGRGIVHRDLKPENLFLSKRRDGSPCLKVLDFGLSKTDSKVNPRRRGARPLTMDGRTFGTPNYISPEQWTGARDVSPAADQWTLGAILYELLTGEPAFDGPNVGVICGKVLQGQVAPLLSICPSLPPALATAVHRALDKSPTERFPTVLEFAAAIAPFAPEHARISVDRIAALLRAAHSDAELDRREVDPVRSRPPAGSPVAATAAKSPRPSPAATAFVPAAAPVAGLVDAAEEQLRENGASHRRVLVLLGALGVGLAALAALALGAFDEPAPVLHNPGADTAAAELPGSSEGATTGGDEVVTNGGAAAANDAGPAVDSAAPAHPPVPPIVATPSRGKGKLPAPSGGKSAPASTGADDSMLFGRK